MKAPARRFTESEKTDVMAWVLGTVVIAEGLEKHLGAFENEELPCRVIAIIRTQLGEIHDRLGEIKALPDKREVEEREQPPERAAQFA